MTVRCKAISKETNMRCVRGAGHALVHVFPSDEMKRHENDYWKALQEVHVVLTIGEINQSNPSGLMFDFSVP